MWRPMRTGIRRLYIIMLWYQPPHWLWQNSDWLYQWLVHEGIFHQSYLFICLVDFFSDCPCNLNCPNGCNGCPNPICVCGENPSPQNEDNLQECKKEKSIDLGQCIIDCKDDQSCEQSCVNLFKALYNECPCQVRSEVRFFHFSTGCWLSIAEHLRNLIWFLRMVVCLDAHVIHLIANRTKNQS